MCGLTRFSIIVQRASGPLTVTLQNEYHSLSRPHATARLRLALRDGESEFGEIVLEDAQLLSYPEDLCVTANEVLTRHVPALRQALPA